MKKYTSGPVWMVKAVSDNRKIKKKNNFISV